VTPFEAETRLRRARLSLWGAQRRHDACAVLPPPRNRRGTVRKGRIAALAADDLRRAEEEYEAAKQAAEGASTR
jgi:hypothetical protein